MSFLRVSVGPAPECRTTVYRWTRPAWTPALHSKQDIPRSSKYVQIDYNAIDAYARNAPVSVARNLNTLSAYLTAPAESDLARLTRREREVLALIRGGLTNKAIARELGISPGTVKAHVEKVIAKLGVSDRAQAVALGFRRGLVT